MRLNVIAATLLVLLAGCAPETPVENGHADAVSDAPAPTPSPPGRETYSSDHVLDAAIPQEQLDYRISLESPPVYRVGDDVLGFSVGVANTGEAALVGEGTHPVKVGVYHFAPDEAGEAGEGPASRDGAIRAKLPLLVPGEKVVVEVRIPAANVIGQEVRAELIQERVAWMGRRYGKPVLKVGTFQRCGGADATLCDAAGTPLPAR